MFCGSCGREIRNAYGFCAYCGTRVAAAGNEYKVMKPFAAMANRDLAASVAVAESEAPGVVAAPVSVAPPSMHWFVVLLLTWVTCGIFGLFWTFHQAGFIRKIEPRSKARLLLTLTLLLGMAIVTGAIAGYLLSVTGQTLAIAIGAMALTELLMILLGFLAIFSIRKSMVRYYNSVEPIGLRLSRALTFFFHILYFQYHFSRIAHWKQAGMAPRSAPRAEPDCPQIPILNRGGIHRR
jgi:hypothetical protein